MDMLAKALTFVGLKHYTDANENACCLSGVSLSQCLYAGAFAEVKPSNCPRSAVRCNTTCKVDDELRIKLFAGVDTWTSRTTLGLVLA